MKSIGFTKVYLDPGTRLGEILFGLIMVLTFTLIAGIAIKESPDAARELLYATLGCNIAWGIIDGFFYIMTALFERGQRIQTVLAIQKTTSESKAIKIINEQLDDTLKDITTEKERNLLYQNIIQVAKRAHPKKNHLMKEDVLGAIASCWLVIVSTIPAVIPFLFIRQAHLALRVSNLLLIILLFVAGYYWAKYTHTNVWITGFIFMIIGLALVGIAILLGG